MSEEKKEVTITEDKEVLIFHRNKFQKTLIDNILDLRRHEYIKTIKPDYQRKSEQGKYIDVDDLIEGYKKGAANAKSYVAVIDELLAMDTTGTLSEAWREISEETPKTTEKTEEVYELPTREELEKGEDTESEETTVEELKEKVEAAN